jgi:hypothetical protein
MFNSFTSTPMSVLLCLTQTQKAVASASKTQELNFNHPMKYLVAANAMTAVGAAPDKMKLQINGTDVTDAKTVIPHFTSAPIYYHTSAGVVSSATKTTDNLMLIPFCLDTAKVQPTGSLNFSRLDSARLVSDKTSFANTIYAVNYNILRIENGMGGLMYSN